MFEPVDIYPGMGELLSTTIDYAYDPLQRLISAEPTGAGRVASVYDATNQLMSMGGTSYTWVENVNLLGDGTSSYAYTSNKLSC